MHELAVSSEFGPMAGAIGGALIAMGIAGMLVGTGRIAGLSGVVAGLLVAAKGDTAWRVWFAVGMLAAGGVFVALQPETFDTTARVPLGAVAAAGLLVGVGTRLANGCTSGHGLCGIGRGSTRSILATVVFFGVAVATATLVGRLS
jgi:uncharacterized membrane protein YedE/YeeE